jgi:hypothetical protein
MGARRPQLGFDGSATRQLYSVSAGMLGVKLTKKYRVLFWSANVNVSEEDATFDRAVPRLSGVIGRSHVKGLRRQFFYGLALAYADRLTLPVPFVGGSAPLGDDWSFQYLLPVQVAVGFKPQARTRFLAGIGLDGWRSGVEWPQERSNVNYGALRGFLNVRHKTSGRVQVRAEVSYAFAQAVHFSDTDAEPFRYPIDPGISVIGGVNIFFGGSVMERLLDEVLK